jgi:predicted 3-demethylubiquinone-9 3-methyltransferase (glyoxalase superfamily)
MKEITPCLWFDNEAEEAAHFYTSIFKNSRIVDVSRYGEGMHKPEGTAMMVSFELDGNTFTALNGGPEFNFTEAVSFQVSCADQAEVDHYWNSLTADGGEEGQCAWLKDKYGLSWQIIPTELMELVGDPDSGRAQRATQAMLKMRKIDIAALRAAADAG